MISATVAFLILASTSRAHQAIFHPAMWCFNGTTPGVDNQNTNDAVNPLFNLTKSEWWMHHVNKCDEFPPDKGQFLDLPVGQDITVEIATNRAFTTYSYGGSKVSEWGDGGTYNYDTVDHTTCITSPNLHTTNQSDAAGTALAISYTSDLKQVTAENLAVFTVAYHTPWHRLTKYSIPKNLPACPPGGCICVWGWVPNGCGEPNMYMEAIRCNVTGATATKPVAAAKAPVWCEDNQSKCVKGAKQLIYWNQLDGNNIETSGFDLEGEPKSPAYNTKCGFPDGAQNDIFG